MEIVLLQDYENLGYKGDIVQVKPGYARNYLIPKRIASPATPSEKKRVQEEQRQASRKLEQLKQEAEEKARQLQELVISIPVKVGTTGKLFGSVTTSHIAQSLKKEGLDINRKNITLPEKIKSVGNYKATVKVYKDVEAEVTVEVQGVQPEIGTQEQKK